MARIIQLRPQSGTKRRYGSFAGRVEVAAVAVGGGKRARWTYITNDRDAVEALEPEQKKQRLKIVKKREPQRAEKTFDNVHNLTVDYDAAPVLQASEAILRILTPQGVALDPLGHSGDVLTIRRNDEDAILLLLMEI